MYSHHMQDTAHTSPAPAAVKQPQPDSPPAHESAVAHVRTEADTDDRGNRADVAGRPQHDPSAAELQETQIAADSQSIDGSVAASSSAAAEAEEPCAPVQLLTEDAHAVAAAAHAAGVDGDLAAVVDSPRSTAKSKVAHPLEEDMTRCSTLRSQSAASCSYCAYSMHSIKGCEVAAVTDCIGGSLHAVQC